MDNSVNAVCNLDYGPRNNIRHRQAGAHLYADTPRPGCHVDPVGRVLSMTYKIRMAVLRLGCWSVCAPGYLITPNESGVIYTTPFFPSREDKYIGTSIYNVPVVVV